MCTPIDTIFRIFVMWKRYFKEIIFFEIQIVIIYIFPVSPIDTIFGINLCEIDLSSKYVFFMFSGPFISFVCTTFDTIFWILFCWNDFPKEKFVLKIFSIFFLSYPIDTILRIVSCENDQWTETTFLNSKFYFSETFPVLLHWYDLQDNLMWKRSVSEIFFQLSCSFNLAHVTPLERSLEKFYVQMTIQRMKVFSTFLIALSPVHSLIRSLV